MGQHEEDLLSLAAVTERHYDVRGLNRAEVAVQPAVPTLDRLDYKSALQELVSHRAMTGPDYSVRSTGPDHDKRFFAIVKVATEVVGEGEGRSKKSAEQAAASAAFAYLTAS